MVLTIALPTLMFSLRCEDGSACLEALYFRRNDEPISLDTFFGTFTLVTEKTFGNCSNYLPVIIACFGVLSGVLCFKLGKIACKILTQVFDFSIPLVLSTPLSIVVVVAMYSGYMTTAEDAASCQLPFPEWVDGNTSEMLAERLRSAEAWKVISAIAAAVLSFISFLLVTNHVWKPGKERLQQTDR